MPEEEVIKRVMPRSTEAEKSVIGAILVDPAQFSAAADIISSQDFYYPQYRAMFSAMQDLFEAGVEIDLVTLQNKLKEKEAPPETYSTEVLGEILQSVAISTPGRIKYHANIIYEKAVLRRLIAVNEAVADECYAGRGGLEQILEKAEKDLFAVLSARNTREFVPINVITDRVLENIDAASRNSSPVTGLSTGFIDLDDKTSGLQPSDLVLIAARPSMGKTAFVLNLAQHIGIKNKNTTAIFSLEMSKEQLVNRLLSMQSGVSSMNMRTGRLSENEWMSLITGAGPIAASSLIIDDTPGITYGELRSKCRKLKLEKDLKIIIIDYLQLMSGSGRDSRQQEISEISRSLKALARELNCPVVALSQLSRACESRPDHRPMLSDLRESGAIEQDADLVMFLYRDDYYHKDTEAKNIAEVIIAKQRNGPLGTVELHWNPDRTKFSNLEQIHKNP